jgi:CRISPR/Cas system-associated exonuclease Cas4 (RecB family)
MNQPGLSKSRVTAFEQCPKRLWLQVNRRELAELDAGAEARFASGHDVGAAACALQPDGVMIEAEPDLAAAVNITADIIASGSRQVLFEATFVYDGVLVRVDVLEPVSDGGWHVAEVKSSTNRKDYHLGDLATQIWVLQQNNIAVTSAAIRHINNQFVLEQEGNYQGIFVDTQSLEEIGAMIDTRPAIVAGARNTLLGPEPAREMGEHCAKPFACEFSAYCSQNLELPIWPISLLPNTGKSVAATWAKQDIFDLTDVPNGSFTNETHARIHRATLTDIPYHDVEGAIRATADWSYPRIFLDFETIAFALPRWIGTKPYEQIPFQFSAHIQQVDGSLSHHEFLSLDGNDPRRACAQALLEHIPHEGTVIAYAAGFERGCVNRLAELFPDFSDDLRQISSRIVDLLPVTRNHWYHRDQRGSWSIKAVLPTISNALSYKTLAVGDGSAAQLAYLEAIQPETPQARFDEISQDLRTYCGQDTIAMLVLLGRLLEPEL